MFLFSTSENVTSVTPPPPQRQDDVIKIVWIRPLICLAPTFALCTGSVWVHGDREITCVTTPRLHAHCTSLLTAGHKQLTLTPIRIKRLTAAASPSVHAVRNSNSYSKVSQIATCTWHLQCNGYPTFFFDDIIGSVTRAQPKRS